MASAVAPHLTPLILELGGKSPAVIDADADLARAAETIMAGKLLNAGQTCVAPDYVLTPVDRFEETTAQLRAAALRLYPDAERRDFTSLNSPRAHRGSALWRPGSISSAYSTPPRRAIARRLALNPPLDHPIMREEIFGPLLPVIAYKTIEDAIAIVRRLPDPLALYWFGARNARFESNHGAHALGRGGDQRDRAAGWRIAASVRRRRPLRLWPLSRARRLSGLLA